MCEGCGDLDEYCRCEIMDREVEERDICPATHPRRGIRCEFDRGHDGPHAIGALPSARW